MSKLIFIYQRSFHNFWWKNPWYNSLMLMWCAAYSTRRCVIWLYLYWYLFCCFAIYVINDSKLNRNLFFIDYCINRHDQAQFLFCFCRLQEITIFRKADKQRKPTVGGGHQTHRSMMMHTSRDRAPEPTTTTETTEEDKEAEWSNAEWLDLVCFLYE